MQRLAREVEKERGRQARSTRGRVQQRQEGWGERLARLRAEEERAREEGELREKRLELLRKQVRKKTTIGHTEASAIITQII